MRKLIFKITILSMLLILVACSSENNNPNTSGNRTIHNTTLADVFDGSNNDNSTAITEFIGLAGIVDQEITVKVTDGNFIEDTADLTFDSGDDTVAKQITAMKNALKQAVENILTVDENAVDGLSKEVNVDVIMSNKSTTATVTMNVIDGYLFEDKKSSKIFTIQLSSDSFTAPIIIYNATLTDVFNDSIDDRSTAITKAVSLAGIDEQKITLNVDNGIFIENITPVTFDNSDDTVLKQVIAMESAIKQAIDAILDVNKNAVDGLSKEVDVDVVMSNSSTIATVTFTANNGYVFEGDANTKTFKVNLTGTFALIKTIYNSTLENIFNGAENDQSVSQASNGIQAGIGAREITLLVIGGEFQNDNAYNVIFDGILNSSWEMQADAIKKSVGYAVSGIIKHVENNIEGLDKKIEISNMTLLDDRKTATTNITFKVIDGYQFEDETTTKIIVINLTLAGNKEFAFTTIDESAFTIPAIVPAHKTAGIASFIIPNGFGEVGKDSNKVSITFHNKDNLFNEKKVAIQNAIESIDLSLNKSIVLDSIGRFNIDGHASYYGKGNIEVTFKPANGYKFASDNTKTVKIHFQGALIDTVQTIEEIAFNTAATGKTTGRAGVSSISFNENFVPNKIPVLHFNSSAVANKKIEAINGLNYMFDQENPYIFNGNLPEGVRYNNGNVKIKLDEKGDHMWGETHAWFQVTFDANDEHYKFTNGANKKTIDIQINVL